MKRDKVSVLKNYGNIKNAVKVSFANHQIVYQVQFYFVDDFNDARKVSDQIPVYKELKKKKKK